MNRNIPYSCYIIVKKKGVMPMKGKGLLTAWGVVLITLILSSCAFNLFGNFELDRLLSSGTKSEKLSAAANALSSGDNDKAIALAGSVLNGELGLSLTNEQLKKLLDSTSTLYEFAQALYEKREELNDDAMEAVKIILEAAVKKSGKSLPDVVSQLEEIAQELGWDLSEIIPKSKNGDQGDFWQAFETVAGTVVSILASRMDNAHHLKFLTGGYYVLATATQTEDSSPIMYAAFCAWYDLLYMFNLILDTNNDGKVTDEQLVKHTITKPASFTELASDTTSGLYQDEPACNEFVWAYDVMKEVLGILKIEMTLPTLEATDLKSAEKLPDLFDLLSGGGS